MSEFFQLDDITALFNTMNLEPFKNFTDEELAGYLAAACHANSVLRANAYLMHSRIIKLCREVVAQNRKK